MISTSARSIFLSVAFFVSTVQAQGIRLSPDPVFRVAWEDVGNNLTIGRVVGAVFVGDTLIVADASELRLLVLSPTGKLVRTIGGKGAGPSEFNAIGAIAICGTDIFVWDPTLGRFSRFATNGKLLQTLQVPIPQIVDVACSSTGALGLVKMVRFQSAGSASNAASAALFTMWADVYLMQKGGQLKRVAENVSYGQYLRQGGGGAPAPGFTRPAIGFSGSSLVLAGETPDSIMFFAPDGAKRSVSNLQGPPRPTSTHAYRAMVERWLGRFPVGSRDRAAKLAAAAPTPRNLPWQEAMVTDPMGRIWFARSGSESGGTHLTVVSSSGRDIANATVSGSLQLLAIGDSFVAFQRELDSGDSELVVHGFRGSATKR